MALSTEWVALKTGQSGSGGVEYSLNEQIVFVLFFYILRDAGNWSEYDRHISTSSSVIVSEADSCSST